MKYTFQATVNYPDEPEGIETPQYEGEGADMQKLLRTLLAEEHEASSYLITIVVKSRE